jgi:sarcosine oxidase subunit beta
MAKLAEAAALQRTMGLTEIHVLDHEQIREVVPWIATPGLLGATYTPNDGKVTPTDGVAALVKAAKQRGARFREHWTVRSLERVDSGWRLTGPEVVEAERVVVCTGYWATDFLRSFGLKLTIRPQPLYSAITGPALDGQHVPLTLDLDTGFVVEREAEGLIIAILFEENPPGYGHTRMLEEFADLARMRAPSLADLHIARHVVANVDMGGDGHPYVGWVEDGLWMAAGFGGHGVMHGPPVAELLAKTIAGRPDPTVDITPLTPWRKAGAASEWMVAAKKG